MDYSPPGSAVHGDSPGKNTRAGCHAILQINMLKRTVEEGAEVGEAASFTGCVVWREHPWQSSSPALRVLPPLIALNFPSISYPRPLFFGYSFNSSLTISINFASLWLLFFSPSLLTPLFLPSVLTPTPPTIRTIHRSPDT